MSKIWSFLPPEDYRKHLERLPSVDVVGPREANDLLSISDLYLLPFTVVSEAGWDLFPFTMQFDLGRVRSISIWENSHLNQLQLVRNHQLTDINGIRISNHLTLVFHHTLEFFNALIRSEQFKAGDKPVFRPPFKLLRVILSLSKKYHLLTELTGLPEGDK